MLRILTWNMNCWKGSRLTHDTRAISRKTSLLRDMMRQFSPTVVALQEAPPAAARAVKALSFAAAAEGDCVTATDGSWIPVASHVVDDRGWGIASKYVLPTGGHVLVVNVHLLSRLRAQDDDIRLRLSELREYVLTQRKNGICAEIIAGDFNLVPFDRALRIRPPEGFGAHRCQVWIERRAKHEPAYREIYNATWALEGRTAPPLASFHRGSGADAPWYQYDQVLISPELLNGHASTSLITAIGRASLAKSTKYQEPDPDVGSDHFPVLTEVS